MALCLLLWVLANMGTSWVSGSQWKPLRSLCSRQVLSGDRAPVTEGFLPVQAPVFPERGPLEGRWAWAGQNPPHLCLPAG